MDSKDVATNEQAPIGPVDTAQQEIAPAPDGGLVAWLQILAGHLINALTWGYTASYGVFQLYYTTTLNLPPSQVAWVGSVQLFLLFFVGVFAGRAADAGYVRYTVTVGCTLIVVGTLMTSLATEYWQIFLAYGLCTGLGMGLLYMPAVSIIGSYFSNKKAMALGMAASGSSTGSIIFPLIFEHLQVRIGFPWAVRVQGFIALGFSIIIIVLIRPRLPPRKSGPLVEWSAFKEPTYLLFTIASFLIFWCLYFVYFFINTYVTIEIGLSDVAAANVLIVISAVGIPIRPVLGLLADKYYGALPTLIASSTVLGAMLYIWMAVHSVAGIYGWAVVYGIATGATQGMFIGALATLTIDYQKLGVRTGMVFTILGFASLAGPPTAGALLEHGGFMPSQVWAGTVTITGALILVAAKWYQIKTVDLGTA